MAHNPYGGGGPPPQPYAAGAPPPSPPAPYPGAPPPPPPPPAPYGAAYPPPPHVMVGVPVAPQQQQPVIVGYEQRVTDDSCFSCDLAGIGVAWAIFLILFFFPLAWLPCVMKSCRNKVAVPIYAVPVAPAPNR